MSGFSIAYQKVENIAPEFKSIFGVELRTFAGVLCCYGIWDFDIISFDNYMVRQGYDIEKDGSLAMYIDKEYGKKTNALINKLIDFQLK